MAEWQKVIIILASSILILSCNASAAVYSSKLGSARTVIVEGENELSDFPTNNIFSQSVEITSDSKANDPSSLQKANQIIENAYRNCNDLTGVKECHGDTEGCVESKSCSHMSALIMNETHYNVVLYTKCSFDIDQPFYYSSFYSLTINDTVEITEDEDTGNVTVTCAPLARENFKLFSLWPKNEPKCDGGNATRYIMRSSTFQNDISFEEHQQRCENKFLNSTGDVDIPSEFDFVYWHENLLMTAGASQLFIGKNYSEIEDMVDYKTIDNVFYISTENHALNHRSYFSLVSLLILTFSSSLL